jgi:Skp family chaperone for outer membrane proteins
MTQAGVLARLALVLAAAALLTSLWSARARGPRLGFIDPETLMAEHPQGALARQRVEAELEPYLRRHRDGLETIASLREEVDSARSAMDSPQSEELGAKLDLLEREHDANAQRLALLRSKLEQEHLSPLWDRLEAQLETFARARGCDALWLTGGAGAPVVVSEAADLTREFQEWLASRPSSVVEEPPRQPALR